MSKITSPFNFVPLSDIVYYPEWGDNIKHDVPFEDGEDGIIELEITNKSPLFISEGKGKEDEIFSAHVQYGGARKYYIPGSTLKGCFRNVMEILSYGKMEQYDDDSFGYRTFNQNENEYKHYMALTKNVRCGWLWKEADKCYLEECEKSIQKLKHKDIIKLLFALPENSMPVVDLPDDKYFYKQNNNDVPVKGGRYHVVVTGQIAGKNQECIFSVEVKEKVEVPERIIRRFETVHKVSPVFEIKKDSKGYLRKLYDNGEKIPVFFIKDKSEIVCIGLTHKMKVPHHYSIKDLVMRNYDDFVKEKFSQRDMPQCIFGTIGDSSLKGRVQISSAFAEENVEDSALSMVHGVLAQPKASFYPLYLKQDGKSVVDYSTTESTIAGRKRYRIVKDFNIIPLGTGNDKSTIQSHLRPLPAGLSFTCRINVHNLKKAEIGALLSSITFNQTGGCYHNIGMAKAFGYGVIECKIKSLVGLKHTIGDYIDCFDETMSYFLQSNNRRLSSEEQMQRLVSIASPTHYPSEMVQLDFDGCKNFKRKDNPSLLSESLKLLNLSIDEDAVILKEAESLALSQEWPKAISVLNNLKIELVKMGEGVSEINLLIEKYQGQQSAYESEQEELRRKEQEKLDQEARDKEKAAADDRKAERLSKGLAFLLETKANSSELKISSLSQGVSRIRDFLKKNKGYSVTEQDMSCIHEWLTIIPRPTKKQEVKDYEDFGGQSWTYISSICVGAEKWFNELNNK